MVAEMTSNKSQQTSEKQHSSSSLPLVNVPKPLTCWYKY